MAYQKGNFAMDSLINDGIVGHTNGERWNGFACPMFERVEAERIVDTMEREQPGSARYEENTDTFVKARLLLVLAVFW